MHALTRIIKDSLSLPDAAFTYEVSVWMKQVYPDKFILETEDCDFDLQAFADARRCRVRILDGAHSHLEAVWKDRRRGGYFEPRNAFQEVIWKDCRLKVVVVAYGSCETQRYYIVSESRTIAQDFFAEVCAFSSEVQGEILVFRNGNWIRDKDLLEQIAHATLDGLVLPSDVRDSLVADIEEFFDSEPLYRELGVAWKRGLLMLGPPGNGKTHAIKAMINRLNRPALYVRSFKSPRGTVHANIEHVFRRARQSAPCMLILEDLDTLLDKLSLAFFLNEMDGFASNRGVLTLATTNHPEKLDTAILDRPSRFDRKITFSLPEFDERHRFLDLANERREPGLKLTVADLKVLAELTDGFSYAYLKELCLSGLMVWMRTRRYGGMADAMLSQIENLRSQMKREPAPTPADSDDEEDED